MISRFLFRSYLISFASNILVLPLFLRDTGGQSRISHDLVLRHNLNRLVSLLLELLIKLILLLLLLRQVVSARKSFVSLLHLPS